ncbi:MAG: adenosylcobinamide-GDP ribazoletransferase [Ardenticatenaceae bacterium]
MKAFRSALAFLTTIPVPSGDLTGDDFAQASRWYSTVGLIIGLLLVLGDQGLRSLFPEGVAAVLLLAWWIALTGALHWDGLLDCFDALLAPVPPERRLEILKDVHVGAFAAVGGGVMLLLYVALLVELASTERMWALLLAPIIARWLMTYAQARWVYARSSGLGTFMRLAPHTMLIGGCPLLLMLLGGWRPIIVFAFTFLLIHLLADWMARALGGGLTGDCYGAICEVAQVLVLLGFVI